MSLILVEACIANLCLCCAYAPSVLRGLSAIFKLETKKGKLCRYTTTIRGWSPQEVWLKEEDSEIQGSLAQKPLGRTQKTVNEKKQLKSGPVLDTCSKSVKSCLPIFNSCVFPFFNFLFFCHKVGKNFSAGTSQHPPLARFCWEMYQKLSGFCDIVMFSLSAVHLLSACSSKCFITGTKICSMYFLFSTSFAALMCKWRTDCLEIDCVSHQKLWVVADKILPVVFHGIFHPKMFHKPCLSFKASWGIDFNLLCRRKG